MAPRPVMKREDLEWVIAVTTAAQVEDGKTLMKLIVDDATPMRVFSLAALASLALESVAVVMGKDPMDFLAEGGMMVAQLPEEEEVI